MRRRSRPLGRGPETQRPLPPRDGCARRSEQRPYGRTVAALHRIAWCLLALGFSACSEEPPVKQAEPKVEVTTQALLTCGQVAATSCTGTGASLQCSAVTAVSGDYVIAHITTSNN